MIRERDQTGIKHDMQFVACLREFEIVRRHSLEFDTGVSNVKRKPIYGIETGLASKAIFFFFFLFTSRLYCVVNKQELV